MQIQNQYYYELLSEDEYAFLKKKARKDSRLYLHILRIMLIGAVLFSFAGAWKNIQKEGAKLETVTVFSWENYFITLVILLVLFYLSIRMLQSAELNKIKKDLRQNSKIIERVIIEKKTYLPHNHTFHFYLNSRQKLSIQVQENDFNNLAEGDEINIEYSKNAGIYFGYF
jgi:preprotein translocase subunit YajC